ncbi:MAG: HIT family protein [Burkholderiaceae bacterium]
MNFHQDCELCRGDGGDVLYREADLRVVLIAEADYPGFARVIWNSHLAEMSDLAPAQRARVMAVVNAVELAQREVLAPVKINLAAFGNMVPHLHWHVIPRFADDAHFPQPVWGARQRDSDPARLAARSERLPALRAAIVRRLAELGSD